MIISRLACCRKYRKCELCVGILFAYLVILGLSIQLVSETDGISLQNYTAVANDAKPAYRIANSISSVRRVIFPSNFKQITLKPETARFLKSTNVSYAVTIDAPYLMENKDLCSTKEQLTAVIMVHTAPKNYENRMAIRKTWANNSYYSELGTVRTLFLLGRVTNQSLQIEIEREFQEYGDIVQGDFIDSYHNMTLKGVMGYKWLSERCRNATVILKTDDDVVIDTFSFLKTFVPSFLSKGKHMACRRLPRAKIERKMSTKWGIGPDLFKGQNFYPPFCQGFTVVISNNVVQELFESSSVTPFFWIDDVFLYGLVPGNVPGMHYTDLKYGQSVIWGADKAISCFRRKTCSYLSVLLWADVPEMMGTIWTILQKKYESSK